MNNLLEFCKEELNRLVPDENKDKEAYDLQQIINKDILKVIECFCDCGHTGFTAEYAINIINKLLRWQPLTELTGEDDEWNTISNNSIKYQNKRCPFIFKDENGQAYNIEAKIFSDDNGHTWFTDRNSRQYITFPYSVPTNPERIIIDNIEERNIILNKLITIIDNNFDIKYKNLVEENTELKYLVSPEYYEELEKLIIESFNLKKLDYHIDETFQMWNLVSMVYNKLNEVEKNEEE